jgi:predicted Zn-dependent peptidase
MLKKIQLSNGLKIITEEVPDLHSASITILLGVGSAAEELGNNGISHFVEHLMFKGTETRSSQVIAQSIEDYGGSLNAFTEKEMTCYYARVLTEQVSLTLDIFCDMILNSLYNVEELELERQVILEEIKMYEDTPDEVVYDLLFKSAWGIMPWRYL